MFRWYNHIYKVWENTEITTQISPKYIFALYLILKKINVRNQMCVGGD